MLSTVGGQLSASLQHTGSLLVNGKCFIVIYLFHLFLCFVSDSATL